MKGVGEPQVAVVDVVAETRGGAYAGDTSERDHTPLARRSHPELDARQAPVGRVEATGARPSGRAGGPPSTSTRRGADAERPGEFGEEDLRRATWTGRTILGHERRVQRRHVDVGAAAPGSRARDRVALPIDALLGAGQPLVVAETAGRRTVGHGGR